MRIYTDDPSLFLYIHYPCIPHSQASLFPAGTMEHWKVFKRGRVAKMPYVLCNYSERHKTPRQCAREREREERRGSSQDMWFISSHCKCFLHCKCPDILTPLLWKFPRLFLCQPKTLYDLCFLCNTAVGSVIPGGCGWHLIYCSFSHMGKSSDFIAASRTS